MTGLPFVGDLGPLRIEGVRLTGESTPVTVTVEDGVIKDIAPAARTSAPLRLILPGFVDLHTHLRQPGFEASETIATGTRAAAAGGYTDVFAMANTDPVTDTVERVEAMRGMADGASARVHPNAAATRGLAGGELVDVRALRECGVTVFSDDGRCVENEALVHDLLVQLAEAGGMFAQHAQSTALVGPGVVNSRVAEAVGCAGWPPVGEEAIVARDIAIARATGGRLHICHVSTRRSVDLIRWAKSVGAPVSAEVAPHHLLLTDEDAVRRGPALKVNPPLRSRDDVEALREAVRDGTIDAIGTDHAPHPAEAKSRPWETAAFGLTAIETALPIVAEVLRTPHGVDWPRLVEVMSATPARHGGVAAPRIEVGADADFCVVEEGGPWQVRADEHHSRSRNTPFDGLAVGHRVICTVLAGRVTHSV
ncbi:dihydroorotase [Dactylosporangium sp. NPDC000555]|uniref:dihydroorotase n=1 Tax=Dactylosporangium sp. NPDC000555 TaxID=3154260 RepID=UPI003327CE0F